MQLSGREVRLVGEVGQPPGVTTIHRNNAAMGAKAGAGPIQKTMRTAAPDRCIRYQQRNSESLWASIKVCAGFISLPVNVKHATRCAQRCAQNSEGQVEFTWHATVPSRFRDYRARFRPRRWKARIECAQE